MTFEDAKFAIVSFSAVLVVVDPFAALPIFMSMTARDSEAHRRAIARRAALTCLITLSVFAAAGGFVFEVFGISLGAFKIAGGLLLLLMAIDMMKAQPSRTRSTSEEESEGVEKEDVAIVPLAIPMLSGPAAIATVMVLMSRAAWRPAPTVSVFLAIGLTSFIAWLLLRGAALAEQVFRATTIRIIERVMGLLVAAVAVEFVIGGLRDLLPTLR